MELEKFWMEEISRTIEALKMRRVDPIDLERWKSFHTNLNKTIKSWKVHCGRLLLRYALLTDQKRPAQTEIPSSPQTLRHDNESSSKVCPYRFQFDIASLY